MEAGNKNLRDLEPSLSMNREVLANEGGGGSSTSVQAAQIRENRLLRVESLFQQAPPTTEGEEVLRDVLTIHDKIVYISFDDVFTKLKMLYSRKEDVLRRCGYCNKDATKTEPDQKVLVFAARSWLT
uniref:Uncharacterized protein n=1 Tax=Glossina palpalis gambiensis TaxID=67801 RepID=A0A1B0C4M8_9MUSC